MHFLDFLSDSPKIFIFQKETTKTNFGGVLFFIYIITMILISFAYIYAYWINDKYTYEGMVTYNNIQTDFKGDERDEIKLLNNDEKINPLVNFSLLVENRDYEFAVYDLNTKEYIKKTQYLAEDYYLYNLTRRVTDFNIEIRYICDDDQYCSDLDRFGFSKKVFLFYGGYELNHTGEIPLKKIDNYSSTPNPHIEDYYKGTVSLEYNWEVIKYRDQKSLFDLLTKKEKEYTYGYITRNYKIEQNLFNGERFPIETKDNKIGYYISMYNIKINNNHYQYLFFKRKKVELLDVLANIGALFSTIKFFFAVGFQFYAKNFDNYKILGKILNTSNESIKKVKISADFAYHNNISSTKKKEEKEGQIIELENIDPLIDNNSKESKLNIKENDDNIDIIENNIDESNSILLNKLSFYDFFFNNIYSKCCRKIRNQEIINTVNEILHKYLSIDNLLHNQLKLENLFKDYKWNNLSLNNIQNNQLIKKLKKI